jgi:hypothetical protein
MTAALLYKTNALLFPGGRTPGFDPSHVAANKIRYSGIPAGATFLNLLNNTTSTIGGTASLKITPMGPAVYTATGAANYNSVTATASETPIAVTQAAIVTPITSNASGSYLFCTDVTNATTENALMILSLVVEFSCNGSYTSGITLSLNTPYFVAVSVRNNSGNLAGNFVVINLLTGQIFTATLTGTSRILQASTFNWGIGGNTLNSRSGVQIAAVMYSVGYLSLQQLLLWAQAPWDFWYPPKNQQLIFMALKKKGFNPAWAAGRSLVFPGSPH